MAVFNVNPFSVQPLQFNRSQLFDRLLTKGHAGKLFLNGDCSQMAAANNHCLPTAAAASGEKVSLGIPPSTTFMHVEGVIS